MATRQVLKDEFLTCIICHEVFRDPVTLHCGHTLCAQCVTGYTKTQKEAINNGCIACPHCRGMTKIPDPKKPIEEWTTQLKTGFFVQGLVEKFAHERKDEDDNCSLCREDGEVKPAAIWCSDCGYALCTDCQKVHRKLNKDHEVVELSEECRRSMQRKSERSTCQKHPEYVIDLLCEDCDLTVCQRCCTLHHRKCQSVILLADALSKFDPVLKEYKKQVDSEVADVQSELSSIRTSVDNFLDSTAQTETEIKAACERLIEKIREKEKHLKENLDRRKEETLESMEADAKSVEMRLEEAKQRQSFLEQALESSDANTCYQAYKLFSKTMTTTHVEYKPKVYGYYLFNDNTDALLKVLETDGYGDIQKRILGARIPPRLVSKLDTGSQNISGLTVMYPKGIRTIVVACTVSKCIQVFSTKDDDPTVQLDNSSSIDVNTLQFEDQVYDVAKISDAKAASSLYSPKQIVFFSVSPQLKVESIIETQKKYLSLVYLNPATLAASAQLPGCIDIIDMTGNIMRTFGSDLLDYPRYMSAGGNGCVLVSDINKSRVISFNGKGEIQFKYQTPLAYLRGICQSLESEVFFVDRKTNMVVELTETGQYARDVLTETDSLNNPNEIFVDGSLMYVSNCDQYIHIYQYREWFSGQSI